MSLCRVPCSDRPASAAAISGRFAYEVRREPRPGGVGEQPAACVDDDHPARRGLGRPACTSWRSSARVVRPGGGGGRDDLRLRRGLRLHLGVDAARQAEHERDLEHDQHEHQHVGERGKQSQPEAQRELLGRRRSGSRRRAPCGCSAGRRRRRRASCAAPLTWTSRVFVEPNQFTSQTSSISRSRETTVPASCISSASRSNSFRASSMGSPSRLAVRRAGRAGRRRPRSGLGGSARERSRGGGRRGSARSPRAR